VEDGVDEEIDIGTGSSVTEAEGVKEEVHKARELVDDVVELSFLEYDEKRETGNVKFIYRGVVIGVE
jgi:hypothetical protein